MKHNTVAVRGRSGSSMFSAVPGRRQRESLQQIAALQAELSGLGLFRLRRRRALKDSLWLIERQIQCREKER